MVMHTALKIPLNPNLTCTTTCTLYNTVSHITYTVLAGT